MRTGFLISVLFAGLITSSTASATTVAYNTTGSTLSCNSVAGCVQNTATSVTLGGLTFTYNAGSGSGVVTPSIINLGNIVSTGTGVSVNVTGLLLTINVNSTPPGASGTLPNGAVSGSISTNSSGATILFSPNNTTTGFGVLPGVVVSGGGQLFTYQVLNPSLGLQAPTVGNPVGQTSIQGAVSAATVVTSVGVPANGTYGPGQVLGFTVNFSAPVTVTGTPFIPLSLDIGGTVDASYVSGSGTSALTFQYTVIAGEQDTNGITVGSAIALNGGTIRDASSTNAVLTLNGVPSTTGVLVGVTPPALSAAFSPTSVALGSTSILTFTATNPNSVALTNVQFSNTLPSGLTLVTQTGGTCGTLATGGGSVNLNTSTGFLSVTSNSLAAGASCTISLQVHPTNAGSFIDTTSVVTSANGGTGNAATASLAAVAPPTIAKAFGAASIPQNGTTSLTFTINNPNAAALTGVAFTDTLPAGLVVSTPNALTNTCGGTATATAGASAVSLSGGTLAGSASCTISVNVTGITAGVKNNSVTIASTEGGTGNTSNASITVVGAPTISKVFGAVAIPVNDATSLTFTIVNPNTADALTGVGFTDPLPAGLVVGSPNGLTGSCGGGTITAVAGSSSVSLSGATLPADSSCTFSVNVLGTAGGTVNNITGAVTSNEGGTGGTASASLTVAVLVPVPSLDRWALLLLVLALAAIGVRLRYRHTRVG